ncbi:MAG TPA: hypothetical protein VL463_04270 [Kofleriaceae bacterium]|nr:hypothetical protein [Kofleriaceae bacterium]
MARLSQRKGLQTRTYELELDKIRVSQRSPFKSISIVVPAEVVLGDRVTVTESSWPRFALAVFCTICAVSWPFMPDAEVGAKIAGPFLAAAAWAWWWSGRVQQTGFTRAGMRLNFLGDEHDPALAQFLAEVRADLRARIRRRILPLEPTGDAERDREAADWLRSKDLITEEEREELERALARRVVRPEEAN